MSTFTTALAPILVLILVGFGLKRMQFMSAETWAGLEKLTYYVLLPALLIRTLGKQTLVDSPWPSMLLVSAVVLAMAAVTLVAFYQLRKSVSAATFTSIFQGGVRFNSYIALSVSQALFGAAGLAFASVAAGFMIVLINLMCVSAFVLWGTAQARGLAPFMREVIRNPLIIGCVIGWFLSVTGTGLPGITESVLEFIGRAALPFGLLAVGAALRPELVRGHFRPIAISSVVQFVFKPLATALLIAVTGLTGIPASVLVIAFMTPTATSSYILARQLGGDAETMASIITFQTLLAFIVMPVIAAVLMT